MQKLTHFIHRNKILLFPLQNLHKILLHINVDRAVADESPATLDVTGEGRDEVRVPDQLVDVADEGTAGHMAAGDFVDRDFDLCSSHGVELGYEVGHSCFLKDDFDVIIVSL